MLLSETIYNIGELLEQPILSGLKGTQNEWIYDILNLVNDGKVLEFQAKLPSLPPALQSDKILQKIRIIALMERVFRSN